MKFWLIIILISFFGYIGFSVSKSYYERKKFFFSMLKFLELIKADITFASKKLSIILDNTRSEISDKNLCILVNNYVKNIDGELSLNGLFSGVDLLTNQEKESLYIFFKKLGMLDLLSQHEMITITQNLCKTYYEDASDQAKKYGSMFTKLGIILGAFVSLMIL